MLVLATGWLMKCCGRRACTQSSWYLPWARSTLQRCTKHSKVSGMRLDNHDSSNSSTGRIDPPPPSGSCTSLAAAHRYASVAVSRISCCHSKTPCVRSRTDLPVCAVLPAEVVQVAVSADADSAKFPKDWMFHVRYVTAPAFAHASAMPEQGCMCSPKLCCACGTGQGYLWAGADALATECGDVRLRATVLCLQTYLLLSLLAHNEASQYGLVPVLCAGGVRRLGRCRVTSWTTSQWAHVPAATCQPCRSWLVGERCVQKCFCNISDDAHIMGQVL